MKRTFCVYSIVRPMVHHIEMYCSEKLFDENEMIFFNATGIDLHGWLTEALIAIEQFQKASYLFLNC